MLCWVCRGEVLKRFESLARQLEAEQAQQLAEAISSKIMVYAGVHHAAGAEARPGPVQLRAAHQEGQTVAV